MLSSLILCNINESFLNQIVTCNEKWILYNWQWPTQWLDWEEASKHFPMPNRHQKRSWSLFSGLLPVWFTTVFWILAKPLHLTSMLSKLMRCTETAMPEASIGQQKGSNSYLQENPIARCTTSSPKVEWIGLWCFALFTMFTWRLTNWLLLLQTSWQLFAGKTLPQWTGCRKCFSRVHQILKHGFLCYRDKQISHWQTCWL